MKKTKLNWKYREVSTQQGTYGVYYVRALKIMFKKTKKVKEYNLFDRRRFASIGLFKTLASAKKVAQLIANK